MRTYICLNCGREFSVDGPGHPPKYCSLECNEEYMKQHRKEYEREYYRRYIARKRKNLVRLKTYDEIKAYNRKHPIPEGWRGQSPFWGYFQP